MNASIPRTLSVLAVLLSGQGCGGTSPSPQSQAASASLAPTPGLKAAMELGSAQMFEKSRKTKQALDAYRRIVQEYPDSPQARIAAERVRTLKSK